MLLLALALLSLCGGKKKGGKKGGKKDKGKEKKKGKKDDEEEEEEEEEEGDDEDGKTKKKGGKKGSAKRGDDSNMPKAPTDQNKIAGESASYRTPTVISRRNSRSELSNAERAGWRKRVWCRQEGRRCTHGRSTAPGRRRRCATQHSTRREQGGR